MMSEPQPFHRLFGLSWMDFFQGTSVTVETEVDLSLKQQFLDVVIIHTGADPIPRRLPDGFEELAAHNLLTFKSHQEALDSWTLLELIGHFVNYRKQSRPALNQLRPESDYRLFAVCARFPAGLAGKVALAQLSEGVYEVRALTLSIRIIVVSQLPQAEHNAMLHLFSASEELLQYGQAHYHPYSADTSTLLYQLLREYSEGSDMTDKLKEFVRRSIDELLESLPAEKLRERLSNEERLKGMPAEERLKGMPAEERLKGLSTAEQIRALSPEAREALARQLKNDGNGSNGE